MSSFSPYSNLRFERLGRRIPYRLLAVGAAAVLFTLAWWLVPVSGRYWLMLLLVMVLTWAASYGWRQATATLIALLRRLEQS